MFEGGGGCVFGPASSLPPGELKGPRKESQRKDLSRVAREGRLGEKEERKTCLVTFWLVLERMQTMRAGRARDHAAAVLMKWSRGLRGDSC